jgi:hypothetical protein
MVLFYRVGEGFDGCGEGWLSGFALVETTLLGAKGVVLGADRGVGCLRRRKTYPRG